MANEAAVEKAHQRDASGKGHAACSAALKNVHVSYSLSPYKMSAVNRTSVDFRTLK
jgi:hypothetical protein